MALPPNTLTPDEEQRLLTRAVEIAALAHGGQQDNAGAPYLLHILRVASRQPTVIGIIVGLLHDMIEDSDGVLTAGWLRGQGFPDAVVERVVLLTRAHGEPYRDYIARIKQAADPVVLAVKRADLEHNLDETRPGSHTHKVQSLRNRYRTAYKTLFGYTP